MNNPKEIVATGYNQITQSYLQLVEAMGMKVREKYLKKLITFMPANAQVLELGCGAGIPMTQILSEHFQVTGIDISSQQLSLARQNVPQAKFILSDMVNLEFESNYFDAIVAFYSITHVPRLEHKQLLSNIYRMLKKGGLMMLTMGYGDSPDTISPDWFGSPMFFSHFDGDTNLKLVQETGFNIIQAEDEIEYEYNNSVCFRWVVASKLQ